MLHAEQLRSLLVNGSFLHSQALIDPCGIVLTNAVAQPERPAIRWAGGSETYLEFAKLIAEIAQRLPEGEDGGGYVAIYAEKTPATPAAMLAAMSRNLAFVLLDPKLPPERLVHMMAVTRPLGVVTRDRVAAATIAGSIAPAIVVPETGKAVERPLDLFMHAPVPERDAMASAAYTFFTSGSTGRPKAAEVSLAGMLNHLYVKIADLGLGAVDTVAQLADPNFDVFVWQAIAPLLAGGTLELLDGDAARDPDQVAELILERGVTVFETVPSFLALLLDSFGGIRARRSKLRCAFSNAETLGPDLTTRWFAAFPGTQLYNSWGATECSDDVSHFCMTSAYPGRNVPVGTPIANATVVAVHDDGRRAAPGEVGELWIGGIPVGLGYKGDPERTAQSFVHGSAGVGPGRFYRTGDSGRILADGTVEFIGRTDHQVKIRGHRVELGEIEAALRTHSAVADAAVVAPDLQHGRKLVAYALVGAGHAATDLHRDETRFNDDWRTLWQSNYEQRPSEDTERFNAIGWNSSFTGKPLPIRDVEEWVDNTVARILSLRPRRVLEIGCGSGLLLHRIAPCCERYVGLDYAQNVVEQLRAAVTRAGLRAVTVLHAAAEELNKLDETGFDLVVINSVVQYFPSLAHLEDVLLSAASKLSDGGAVFVGDVRDQRLLEAFHERVWRARHPEAGPPETAALHAQVARDKELVISPGFFAELGGKAPFRSSAVLVKEGNPDVEMTTFRYDVVLSTRAPRQRSAPRREWKDGDALETAIAAELQPGGPPLRLTGLPNGRITPAGIDPGDLCKRVRSAGLHCAPVISTDPFHFDLVIGDAEMSGPDLLAAAAQNEAEKLVVAGNAPARASGHSTLRADLFAHLKATLPEYMLPVRIVVREDLPRLASGKIDRGALDAEARRELPDQDAAPPQTDLESLIAGLWAGALEQAGIGRTDNFFSVGGHSLLAAGVVSKLRVILDVKIPLKLHFEHPTVAALAAEIERLYPSTKGWTSGPAHINGKDRVN